MTEAGIVMFTNYKRTDGFEVSITLRGEELSLVAGDLDMAIKSIIKAGGTPVSRQSQKYSPKPVEYVENRVCPKDGGRLIKPEAGSNKPIKCENGKYDWKTKTTSGCQYIEWPKSEMAEQVDKSFTASHNDNMDEPTDINF